MSEQRAERSTEPQRAPAGQLSVGPWIYRTNGEGLRLAGHAGKPPSAIVQILATDVNRSPEQIQALTTAYRRVSTWSSPGCLLPIDFGILAKTGVYITFPLLPGRFVRDLVNSAGTRLPASKTAALLRPIAECLDQGHREGLLHLSICGTQIIVGSAGQSCALLDFGLREIVLSQDAKRDRELDRDRWSYWAPEVWQGATCSPATDQFALAAVAYQLLVGSALPAAAPSLESADQQQRRMHAAIAAVSPTLQPIFARAFALRPADRFASCAELMNAILATDATLDLRGATPAASPGPSGTHPLVADPAIAAVYAPQQSSSAEALDLEADYDVVTDFSAPDTPSDGEGYYADMLAPDTDESDAPVKGAATPFASSQDHAEPTATTAAPRLRDALYAVGLLGKALVICILVAAPVLAWRWSRENRPRLILITPPPLQNSVSVPPISDQEINNGVQAVHAQLASLKDNKLPELAPAAWKESEQVVRKLDALAKTNRVSDLIAATNHAKETLSAKLELCADLTRYESQHQAIEAQMAASPDSPEEKIKRYDDAGWQQAVALKSEAAKLRAALKTAEAEQTLAKIPAYLLSRRKTALENQAWRSPDLTEQLAGTVDLLNEIAVADRDLIENPQYKELAQHFDTIVRQRPEFWLELAADRAKLVTGGAKAAAFAELAHAQHEPDKDNWRAAFNISRQAALATADPEQRTLVWQSLLETALEMDEIATASEVLKEAIGKSISGSGAPAVLGYALLLGDEQLWTSAGPAVFGQATDRNAAVIEALTVVGRQTADLSAALEFADKDASLRSRYELLVAIAEIGDAKNFNLLARQLDAAAASPLGQSDKEMVAAYSAAGKALLGDYGAVAKSLNKQPEALRDVVAISVSLAAARGGHLEIARKAFERVSADNPRRIRLVREFARYSCEKERGELGGMLEWMSRLPSKAEQAAFCASAYATLNSKFPVTQQDSKRFLAPRPPAQICYEGSAIGSAGAPQRIKYIISGPIADRELATADILREESDGYSAATVKSVTGFTLAREAPSRRPASPEKPASKGKPAQTKEAAAKQEPEGHGKPAGVRHALFHGLIEGKPTTLGLRAGSDGIEVVQIDRSRDYTDEEHAAARQDAIAAAFAWLVTPQQGGKFERWALMPFPLPDTSLPSNSPKGEKDHRRFVNIAVSNANREQSESLARIVEDLNDALRLPTAVREEGVKGNAKMLNIMEGFEAANIPRNGVYLRDYLYVIFSPKSEHYGIASKAFNIVNWPKDAQHHAQVLADDQRVIAASVVMIDAEMSGEALDNALTFELLRAIGISQQGRYPTPWPSVFTDQPLRPDAKAPTTLTPGDKLIVRFIYNSILPADDVDQARSLFRTGWKAFTDAQRSEKPTRLSKSKKGNQAAKAKPTRDAK